MERNYQEKNVIVFSLFILFIFFLYLSLFFSLSLFFFSLLSLFLHVFPLFVLFLKRIPKFSPFYLFFILYSWFLSVQMYNKKPLNKKKIHRLKYKTWIYWVQMAISFNHFQVLCFLLKFMALGQYFFISPLVKGRNFDRNKQAPI